MVWLLTHDSWHDNISIVVDGRCTGDMTEKNMVAIFKALGDENRIRILKLLHSGEKCACKLLEELNVSQSTLSHHMKILCDAGIVTGRKEGKWMHYSICCEGICSLRTMLRELLAPENLPADCNCKEK